MKSEYYYKDGSILNYLNDSKLLHRVDGPAFISYYLNGKINYEEYWLEGELHREDGPAFIGYLANGEVACEEYYLEGTRHLKGKYKKIIEKVKNMDEAIRLIDPRKWVRKMNKAI